MKAVTYTETYRGFDIAYKENHKIACSYDKDKTTNIANFDIGSVADANIDTLKSEVKRQIDEFLDNIPSTEEGWIKKLDDCVGYDGIDPKQAKHVLRMYKEFCR